MFICIDCQSAIEPTSTSIADHVQKIHKDCSFRVKHTNLNKIICDLNIQPKFDAKNPPNNCPAIEGLYLTTQAYLCSECSHIRGTIDSIKQHFQTSHSSVECTWSQVTAQQIHHKNHTPYFRVFPASTLTNTNAPMGGLQFLEEIRTKGENTLATFNYTQIDPRQVSPWLRKTRWHKLVAQYDHNHLIQLVKMPGKQEPQFEILAKCVHVYASRCCHAIDTLPELALKVINSPDEQ